jgi:hypothetical protein
LELGKLFEDFHKALDHHILGLFLILEVPQAYRHKSPRVGIVELTLGLPLSRETSRDQFFLIGELG